MVIERLNWGMEREGYEPHPGSTIFLKKPPTGRSEGNYFNRLQICLCIFIFKFVIKPLQPLGEKAVKIKQILIAIVLNKLFCHAGFKYSPQCFDDTNIASTKLHKCFNSLLEVCTKFQITVIQGTLCISSCEIIDCNFKAYAFLLIIFTLYTTTTCP